MNICVTVPAAELLELLRTFTPTRIMLSKQGEDPRWVELGHPNSIEIVPGRGVVVALPVKLRYTIAGFSVPWVFPEVVLALEPRIIESGDAHKLAFFLALDKVDIAALPSLVKRPVLQALNNALTPDKLHMVVPLGTLLNRSVRMPRILLPLDHLHLRLEHSTVEVDEHGLRLTLPLQLQLTRHPDGLSEA